MTTIWLGREVASTGRLNGQLKPKKSQNHGWNRLLVSLFLSVPVGLYLPPTNLVFFLEKHQAFQVLRSLVSRLQGKVSSIRVHEGGSVGQWIAKCKLSWNEQICYVFLPQEHSVCYPICQSLEWHCLKQPLVCLMSTKAIHIFEMCFSCAYPHLLVSDFMVFPWAGGDVFIWSHLISLIVILFSIF